jgi:hypothetical protein
VAVTPSATTKRASPPTNAAGPPSSPPPRCGSALPVIPRPLTVAHQGVCSPSVLYPKTVPFSVNRRATAGRTTARTVRALSAHRVRTAPTNVRASRATSASSRTEWAKPLWPWARKRTGHHAPALWPWAISSPTLCPGFKIIFYLF